MTAMELSWLERTTHNRKVKSSSLFIATIINNTIIDYDLVID